MIAKVRCGSARISGVISAAASANAAWLSGAGSEARAGAGADARARLSLYAATAQDTVAMKKGSMMDAKK